MNQGKVNMRAIGISGSGLITLSAVALFVLNGWAHPPHSHEGTRKIEFPDIPGYKTLKTDFHQHTALSDGNVWPPIRVEEAVRDGLDAISLTEHLEYQPHKKDIPHPDRNRAYQIASPIGKKSGVIVVSGSEITRDMPPGHGNAIFLKDSTKLVVDDPLDAYKEAGRQGAFIFWNHPNWIRQSKDASVKLTEMHKKMIADGLLHGIEVVNNEIYSDDAIQIALDHNLTMMGTSDIHGLIDWQYDVPQGGHRPVTLVFAKEKSEEALKESLMKQRTVVWFKNTLIGRPEFLNPLIQASLVVKKVAYIKDSFVASVEIENKSDAAFMMENLSGYALHGNADIVQLAPHETTEIKVMTLKALKTFDLKFKVWNAVTAPGKHPEITVKIDVK